MIESFHRPCWFSGLVVAAFFATGCIAQRRSSVPGELATASRIDLSSRPDAAHPVDSEVMTALESRFRANESAYAGTSACKKQILALSGGGKFGAYSAGLLNGWTATGSRPAFDIVTGISTGSLVATFAYLGPAYDAQLRCLYTSLETRDVVRRRPLFALLWSDSLMSSAPLARLIEEQIDDALLAQVAAAHTRGRRLYVGTTNLDTKRLTIWDMGGIAVSTRPEKLALFRRVLLASCSVPGALPPVPIDVTMNGRSYTEMHADGGTTSGLFLRASLLGIDAASIQAGQNPLAGSELYVVVAGKLYADPGTVQPRLTDVASSAASSILYAATRGDIIRLYSLSMLTGMNFHVAALSQSVKVSDNSLSFEPAEMMRLFEAGYADGQNRSSWRRDPPGAAPQEQELPRAGTDFLAPGPPPRR